GFGPDGGDDNDQEHDQQLALLLGVQACHQPVGRLTEDEQHQRYINRELQHLYQERRRRESGGVNRDASRDDEQGRDVGEDGGADGTGDGLIGDQPQPLNDRIAEQRVRREHRPDQERRQQAVAEEFAQGSPQDERNRERRNAERQRPVAHPLELGQVDFEA